MPAMIPWQGFQQDSNPEHSSTELCLAEPAPGQQDGVRSCGVSGQQPPGWAPPQPGAELQGHSPGCSRGMAAAATELHRTNEGEGKQDSCFPCDLPGLTDASADGSDERRPTAEAGMKERECKPDFGWNI